MNREEFERVFATAATPIWERIRNFCSAHPAVPTLAVVLPAVYLLGYCHG